jgi:hypothetical protein
MNSTDSANRFLAALHRMAADFGIEAALLIAAASMVQWADEQGQDIEAVMKAVTGKLEEWT